MEATIEVINEVYARVQLSELSDIRYLDQRYAIPKKNHFFNPKFTVGAWDGKQHFYNSTTGKTYTYLLPEIIDYLGKNGYVINLTDQRSQSIISFRPVTANEFSHVIYPDTGQPLVLAEHQLRVINQLLAETNGVAEAATGAGKTAVTGAMCTRFLEAGLKTIVIVPSLDLIENTRDELMMMGITDVGVFSGLEKNIVPPIVISTWQSLSQMPVLMRQFNCVLVDETHGARGEELNAILIEYGDHIVYRYGMTGTLPDDPCDAMRVHIALGPTRAVVEADELIRIGWLATVEIDMKSLDEDLMTEYKNHQSVSVVKTTYQKFKQSYFPDFKAEFAYLIKNKRRQQWIADYIDQLRINGGNTFVLVKSIPQGRQLAALCPNATFVHGADKVKVRKQIYQLFKDNDDVLVFATVGIASTGINIKRIFNLVTLDIGKSFIRTIQSIGRGLRRGAGKDHLVVTDIHSDLKYGAKHAKERVKFYKQKKYPYHVTRVDYANA